MIMELKVDGKVIGEVDPQALTIGDQLDLEDARTVRDVMYWLVDHAGADEEALEETLRPLPLPEVLTIARGISEALGAAIPNESGERSSRRSPRMDRARRAG
jgi:hypothetical protein